MMLDPRIRDVGNKVLAHRSEQNTICLNGFAASLLMLVVEKTAISNKVAGVCGFRAVVEMRMLIRIDFDRAARIPSLDSIAQPGRRYNVALLPLGRSKCDPRVGFERTPAARRALVFRSSVNYAENRGRGFDDRHGC